MPLAAVLVLLTVVGATLAPTAAARTSAAAAGPPGVPPPVTRSTDADGLAGWAVDLGPQNLTLLAVSVSFPVPSVNCAKGNGYAAFGDVLSTSSLFGMSFVLANCSAGTLRLSADLYTGLGPPQILDPDANLTAAPWTPAVGDDISASVAYLHGGTHGNWVLNVTDRTSGRWKNATVAWPPAAANYPAFGAGVGEWMVAHAVPNGNPAPYPQARFAKVTFTNASVLTAHYGTLAFGAFGAYLTEYTCVNSTAAYALDATKALSKSGRNFSVKFLKAGP